jgi:Ras family
MYYRGAHAALLVYDITSRDSFERAKQWTDELEAKAGSNQIRVLVGNKCDMEEDRAVQVSEAEKYAAERNLVPAETSAKLGTGVDEIFTMLGMCPLPPLPPLSLSPEPPFPRLFLPLSPPHPPSLTLPFLQRKGYPRTLRRPAQKACFSKEKRHPLGQKRSRALVNAVVVLRVFLLCLNNCQIFCCITFNC